MITMTLLAVVGIVLALLTTHRQPAHTELDRLRERQRMRQARRD